jgi:type VI protein secretion system component VasF
MRARLAEKERQYRRDHQRRIRTLRGMALVGLLLASVLAYFWYAWK